MVHVSLIAAIDTKTQGIGANGGLPWHIPEDMEWFKRITRSGIVIMGKKTWESIPNKPLCGRTNIVLSSSKMDLRKYENTHHSFCLEDVIKRANPYDFLYIIGGERLYKEAFDKNLVNTIYLTEIQSDKDIVCDCFFPNWDKNEYCSGSLSNRETYYDKKNDLNLTYEFKMYKKNNNDEEQQYLNLVSDVIKNGVLKGDRTGTGTLSVFGRTMRFSLRDNVMPLLTTKRTFWKGVVEELLWFIKGDTYAKSLSGKGVKIWDGNGSKEFLTSRGLGHREEGDLGPIYGFQWRHFGAEYKTHRDNYENQGIDQLKILIDTIVNNPDDRRMILSAWNPAAFHLMALPACHLLAQFYVSNGELSCQMYQRSCDLGLGVPFNIASYSLLTRILAHCTGLKAGEFIHVLGDAHIYTNHVEPLKEQLKRTPTQFPTLKINTDNIDIDKFTYDDFELIGYKPQKSIKMDMAV